MAASVSQFSCLSAVNRSLRLPQRRPFLVSRSSLKFPKFRDQRFNKFSIAMSLEGSGSNTADSQIKTTLSYANRNDASDSLDEGTAKSYPGVEESDAGNLEIDKPHEPADVGTVPKRSAKIHDFCFGIPFGGIVLSGGLISFILSRNPSALTSLISGGALLAFSTLSLKIWRQGKSSFPFILGQAAFTASFLWNNYQTYSLTKRLFPSAFYAVLSAAMLCFYFYVVISGGNPPPKKMKSSPTAA